MDNQHKPTTLRIYKIVCASTGRVYVGSASHYVQRKARHRADLRTGRHCNSKLQNAWNKYGEESFSFVEIECVLDKAHLISREQYWIRRLRPWFNIAKVAGSPLGVKHSEETKAKRRESLRKYWDTHVRVITDEQRKNMSLAKIGTTRVFSEEHKRKLAIAATGRRLSDATKLKISEAHTGKSVTFSDSHKANIAAAWIFRKG